MSSPLVSVIIPCFNAQAWIGETLASVEAQTHPNLEIVVVDDGSSDQSVEVIAAFPSDRVRLIRQVNGGAARARNIGFHSAKGEYIQFLDADDLLNPQKITLQLDRLRERPGCVASSAWARFSGSPESAVFDADSTDRDLAPIDWLVASWHDGGGMLFPGRWLIPRSVAAKAGPWDESLSLNDDGEYFTRIVLASEAVLFCPEAKCYYRSGIPGSLSGTRSRKGWESYLQSVKACGRHALEREDSERVRRAISFLHQRFAYACYPQATDLADEALRLARGLHHESLNPGGSRKFQLLRKMVGWRFALRLQHAYYRFRYQKP